MSGRYADAGRATRRDARRAFKQVRHVFACECGWYTVTVQLDVGVVPDTLGCRAPGGCTGTGRRVQPRIWPAGVPWVAVWEWYEPTTAQLDVWQQRGGPTWEHLSKRGLLLRERPGYRR